MHVVDEVIFAVWVAFWIYWLAASIGVKAGRTQWTRLAGTRVGLILVVLLFVRAGVLNGRAAISDPWRQGIGLTVFVPGLALAVWARVYLGRNRGMPMSQKADPELVTTGPYRSIRPPDLLARHPGDDRHHDRRQPGLAGMGGRARGVLRLQRDCGGALHGRPLPGLLSAVQALDQDADPLHFLLPLHSPERRIAALWGFRNGA
jgi:hypothetical protein